MSRPLEIVACIALGVIALACIAGVVALRIVQPDDGGEVIVGLVAGFTTSVGAIAGIVSQVGKGNA